MAFPTGTVRIVDRDDRSIFKSLETGENAIKTKNVLVATYTYGMDPTTNIGRLASGKRAARARLSGAAHANRHPPPPPVVGPWRRGGETRERPTPRHSRHESHTSTSTACSERVRSAVQDGAARRGRAHCCRCRKSGGAPATAVAMAGGGVGAASASPPPPPPPSSNGAYSPPPSSAAARLAPSGPPRGLRLAGRLAAVRLPAPKGSLLEPTGKGGEGGGRGGGGSCSALRPCGRHEPAPAAPLGSVCRSPFGSASSSSRSYEFTPHA